MTTTTKNKFIPKNTSLTKEESSKLVKKKDLIKKIAELSGYYEYEVRDIYNALTVVIANELANHNPVRLEYLITMIPRKNNDRKLYRVKTGQVEEVTGKYTLKYKMNKFITDQMNGENTVLELANQQFEDDLESDRKEFEEESLGDDL